MPRICVAVVCSAVSFLGCEEPPTAAPREVPISTAPSTSIEPTKSTGLSHQGAAQSISDAGFADSQLGITFPGELGELRFVSRKQYPQPEMGYSLRYDNSHLVESGFMKKSGFMKIDIYVYDQGIPDIPQGHTGETIETELGNAGAAIQIHKEQGLYRDVEKLNAGVYPATGAGESIMFQWSRFQYRQTARPGVAFTGLRVSETFIRGFARHFIKIRFTYPAEASEVALPVRTKAIMQIGELMKAN